MKHIFLFAISMIITTLDCSSQTCYWGEGAYDLEKTEFGLDVKKFYSHGTDFTNFDIFSDEYDKKARYYVVERRDCPVRQGDTISLFEYYSPETDFSDVMACLGTVKFPALGMIADVNDKMIGVIASTELKSSAEANTLLRTLARIYGKECLSLKRGRDNQFAWLLNDRRIQVCITVPKEGQEEIVLYYDKDDNGKRTITQLEYEPYARFKCHVMIVRDSHCKWVEESRKEGVWTHFTPLKYDFTNDKPHDYNESRIDLE